MTSQTILVVEDDEAIRDMVVFNLDRAGYRSLAAGTCQEARVKIADERPDLILLDWMLPDMSGLELARSLRRDELTRELPIIMLTARAMEDDKVRGLDSGVDDYVTKPFGARELIARIHALLRRTQPGGVDDEIEANGLVINVASHRVLANGKPVEVGPDRVPHAQILHDPPGSRLLAGTVARSCLGQWRVRGGAYGGCSYPEAQKGAGETRL
jgi:two-component system, OmpR family, phosphate regulon response regulator PhoB